MCERYGITRSISAKGCTPDNSATEGFFGRLKLIAKRPTKRNYGSYKGEISDAPENLVKREFHAQAPNQLWLTDIIEFSIPGGKAYLSPGADCFDGMCIAWSQSTSPNAELVNSMLDAAASKVHEGEHPVGHGDRGCHYRWPG